MKGASLNFGSIKDTILRYSSKSIVTEGKSIPLSEMLVNEINGNPILKVQYLVYKNLENGRFSKEYLAERFLNQNLSMMAKFDWQQVLTTNRDFRFKALKDSHVASAPERAELYESIHTLIKAKTNKGFEAFDEENKAYEYVVNYLVGENQAIQKAEEVRIDESEMPSLLSWKYVTEIAVNNFNERYSHLTENEKRLVHILTSDEDYKKNYLQDLKEENLTVIESLLATSKDDEMKSDLKRFKDKISSLNENSNLDETIINLYELKCSLA